MLDTSIASVMLNRPASPVLNRILSLDRTACGVSVVVQGELLFGAEKKRSANLRRRVDSFLMRTWVLDLPSIAGSIYAAIRADLERRGQPIGRNDIWIAAHALALGATLVTDNVGEFSRVPGLNVENWLRDPA